MNEPTSAADTSRGAHVKKGFREWVWDVASKKLAPRGPTYGFLVFALPIVFLLTIVAFGDDQGREFETQGYLTTKAANVFVYYKSCQLYNDEKPCRAEAVDRMKANGIEPTFWRRKNGSGQSCGCSCETH